MTVQGETARNHEQTLPLEDVGGLIRPDVEPELEFLRGVFRTIFRVALISTGPSGIITSFNRGAEVLTGYSASEVVGHCTPLFFHVLEEVEACRGDNHKATYSLLYATPPSTRSRNCSAATSVKRR